MARHIPWILAQGAHGRAGWTVHVVSGRQSDPTFVTPKGMGALFCTRWTVSALSNWMGIRCEGSQILWTRENGSEAGSHPGNMLDDVYAFRAISMNGDTPVIVMRDRLDMGG